MSLKNAAWNLFILSKLPSMTRQTNRQGERDRKPDEQKKDAASNQVRYSGQRESKYFPYREKEVRSISLNRYYMNDLYERSSI